MKIIIKKRIIIIIIQAAGSFKSLLTGIKNPKNGNFTSSLKFQHNTNPSVLPLNIWYIVLLSYIQSIAMIGSLWNGSPTGVLPIFGCSV